METLKSGSIDVIVEWEEPLCFNQHEFSQTRGIYPLIRPQVELANEVSRMA